MNRAHQTSIVLEHAKKPYVTGEVLVHSPNCGWDRSHVVVIIPEVMSMAPTFTPSILTREFGGSAADKSTWRRLATAELYREVHP